MFSKLPDLMPVRRGIGFRLAMAYAIFLTLSMLGLLGLAFVLMSTYLRHSDLETIRHRLEELAARYNAEGLDGVQRALGEHAFFVRVAAADGATLFVSIPDRWGQFNLKRVAKLRTGSAVEWAYVPARGDEDVLEVASIGLNDGRGLQVGRSSGHRGALLERFLLILALVMAPLVLVAFSGGAFLAGRALRPLRTFVHTIRTIEAGAIDTRIPTANREDELEELAAVFNRLLDKIATLIQGMRGALDNVAHDLRTPISRIRGVAEIALRTEHHDHHLREALADCIEESDRLLTILNTLMDISEAETGALQLTLEDVELSGLVREVIDLYEYVAEDKALGVTVSVGENLYVPADRNRLRQVLANLLDNAIKYTPPGGRITVEAAQADGAVVILVSDTGLGMAAEELPRIWARLYRGDRSRSPRGLGLGLSLVKAIVQAHGGDVDVASVPGRGSSFRVALPVRDVAVAPRGSSP